MKLSASVLPASINRKAFNALSSESENLTSDNLTSWGLQRLTVNNAQVIEFASDGIGTVAGGEILASICMGQLADISLSTTEILESCPLVEVATDFPLASCIGCQYAGWPISVDKFFAMGSGPIRLLRGKEPMLEEYGLTQADEVGVVVLESAMIPDAAVVELIAEQSGLAPAQLMICIARTSSVPGSFQVVARSIETAMHKLHEIGFDLKTIVRATGSAPLPPETNDDLIALGWTNDAVLYGARVELWVDTDDAVLESFVERTPSCHSSEFGRPFIELFKRYEYDFYQIDPLLFSPAEIIVHNLRTGRRFQAGERRVDILKQSFEQS